MNKKALSVLTGFCILGCLMPSEAQARDHHKHNDGLRLASGIVRLVKSVVAPAPVVVAPAPVVVTPAPVVVVPPRGHVRPAPPPPRRHHGRPVPPPHRGRGR